ncbi:AAA family ATPase [Azorhizobium sp. AG788]|uniref:ParA family protein n=1 Tax=Azorhizobium sp. AG788 TaxID=2183897 RepID=UPI0031393E49
MTIYFDDSLPALVEAVIKSCGEHALEQGVALRDTKGRLSFYLASSIDDEQRALLTKTLIEALGYYARTDRVIAGSNDFGITDLLHSGDIVPVSVAGRRVRLIDRRLVGADWLRNPTSRKANRAPRLVFASLKGGVGRSTALAVVAAHAASRGRRVLAVDLDMEAPGLGAMLLNETTTPKFGMIDALVERALSPLSAELLRDLVGASTLSGRGRVDVVPAFGARSLANPADVLAKIGRAYGEVVREDGAVETLLDQVAAIIDDLEENSRYDLILIDARAGLHEIAAAALFGLGAEILCFGADEPQTFQGYRALFSHVDRYSRTESIESEWFSRVNLVQAKAPPDAELRAEFRRKCERMLQGHALEETQGTVPLPDGFSDVSWDDSVSDADLGLTEGASTTEILSVAYDAIFANFDPLRKRDQLSESAYQNAFGKLIAYVDAALAIKEGTQRP